MLFDTNIFIYADRGVVTAKELIMNTPDRVISAVTYMEYVPFCRNKKELSAFEKLLDGLDFKIYDIDSSISQRARQLVRQFALSHSMEMADALIAATALYHHERLCTSNAKHFLPIDGLVLEIYSPIEKD
ncbi:MAG: type II toxin-antitoxin system VapC family toxin [Methylovulum sp.]|jgi:predicted nucleic acid-binding protein